MTPTRRKIYAVLILVLIGWGVMRSLPSTTAPAGMPTAGSPMPAAVARVIERPVMRWYEFSGRLVAVEDADVRPRVSGTIESVHFIEGDLVQKGDLLFTIDLRPFQAELERARAALARAEAQADLATLERTRATTLLAQHYVSQQHLDERTRTEKEALAAVRTAEADLNLARLHLEYARVDAPISGRVSRPEITVGNTVNAGQNAPVLTTIQSINPIYADFEIDEQTYLQLLKNTASASLADAGTIPVHVALSNETDFTRIGQVQSFDNRLNPTSGTLRVRAVFDNGAGALMPGLFVRVRMGSPASAAAILVQDQAIGTDQTRKVVLRVGANGTLEYQQVTLGAVVDGLRVIEQGLSAGDTIVINGLQRLRAGMTIIPQPHAMDTLQPLTAAPTPPAATP